MTSKTKPFPDLSFPLHIGFASDNYWIADDGPYSYGAAVTAFLCGEAFQDAANDAPALREELESHLKKFGSELYPYRDESVYRKHAKKDRSRQMAQVDCSIRFGMYPIGEDAYIFADHYVFQNLRDFLCTELFKAIHRGNAPRQCRLCGQWFLHVQGEKFMYCERPAPCGDGRTCRASGARTTFERKVQDEQAWQIYQRAYKKYYARFMKGHMKRADLDRWKAESARQRDQIASLIKQAKTARERAELAELLRQELNKT